MDNEFSNLNTKQTLTIPASALEDLRDIRTPKRTSDVRAPKPAAEGSDTFKRFVAVACGVVLLMFGVLQSSNSAPVEEYAFQSSIYAGEMDAFANRTLKSRDVKWPNPEMTYFEENFCRGNRTSSRCDTRWLHPYIEYLRYIDTSFKIPSIGMRKYRITADYNRLTQSGKASAR